MHIPPPSGASLPPRKVITEHGVDWAPCAILQVPAS